MKRFRLEDSLTFTAEVITLSGMRVIVAFHPPPNSLDCLKFERLCRITGQILQGS